MLLAAMAALALVVLAHPGTARAHAFLVRSDPAPGSRLASSPGAVELFFSEGFVEGSVAIRDVSGTGVKLAAPVVRGPVLRQALPEERRGVFVVTWQVLADDGHLSIGEFAFAVGSAEALPAASAESVPTPWPEVLASWLFFLGLSLALGGRASEVFVWRRIDGVDRAVARAPLSLGLGLAAGATLLMLVVLAARKANEGLGSGLAPSELRDVVATRPGTLTLLALAALALAALAVRLRRAPLLPLLPLAVAVAATSLRGHSGTAGHWWAVPLDALHLLTAALWVGALVHLVLVVRRLSPGLRRQGLAAGARRYSQLALPVVLLTIAAGVGSAFAQFTSLDQLLDTGYGNVLLVKGGFIAAALALALAARLRALPDQRARNIFTPRRLGTGEFAAVAAVLLILAGVVAGPVGPGLAAFLLLVAAVTYVVFAVRRIATGQDSDTPRRYVRPIAVAGAALFVSGGVAAFAGSSARGDTGGGGSSLLVNAVLLALGVAVALAALARALPPNHQLRPRLLWRLTSAESLLVVGLLVVTALLVNVAPPTQAQSSPPVALGPPPLQGPALRLGDFAGQLAVGLAAAEGELRFTIIAPSGEPARGARLTVEGERPNGAGVDLYPRDCGRGCFTIQFQLPEGQTHIEATVLAPGWAGGQVRFTVPWPPGPPQDALLHRIARTMTAVPDVAVDEQVRSGPDASSRSGGRMSGKELMEGGEVYGSGAVDVRLLGQHRGLRELAFALPGSNVWYRMWIDRRDRVRRETIVSPGHLIERTFNYPNRSASG